MPDNVTLGSNTYRTDEVGGVQYPVTKLDLGGDGVSAPLSGTMPVTGAGAAGAATTGNPVLVAGSDGTNARILTTDASGRVVMVGPAATGVAVAGNPVLMAGSDGTLVRNVSTDASGRQVMVGPAAAGAAVAGNPVLMAGSDGTNARNVTTDTAGRQVMVGAAAAGAAVDGNPVLVAGTDGTNARGLSVDSSGRPNVVANGETIWTAGFSAVGSSVLDSVFNAPIVGTGVTYNQGAGSLNVLSGTTTNAEFLARSAQSFRGSMRARFTTTLSQRIANNNFALLLADLIGEGLAYTIVSATVVNVTVSSHGFTSQMVGQFVNLGGITGAAGVPGRYAIASIVNANTLQFTVAGWPASGSGTLTLFGRNYVRNLFTGTTATNVAVDVQRNGWATGDTTATINTTASPGVMIQNELTGREVFFSDALRASSTAPTLTTRASRYENIPDSTTDFYVFLWSFNGTTAPASTTTWTLGHVSVESYPNLPVYINGLRPTGQQNPLNVSLAASQTLATVTTVTTVSNVAAIAAGANAIGDVGTQYRANATGAASSVSVISPATPAAATIKASAGRLIGFYLQNSAASLRSVKIFNVAAPTLGTTAATFEIDVPAGGTAQLHFEGGLAFATAMTYSVTSAKGLTDNTATGLALADVSGFFAFA